MRGARLERDTGASSSRSESSGGSGWYRLVVPGLHEYAADGVPLQETGWDSLDDLWSDSSLSDAEKQDIYRSAFQDSCGMPLVTAGLRDAEARAQQDSVRKEHSEMFARAEVAEREAALRAAQRAASSGACARASAALTPWT